MLAIKTAAFAGAVLLNLYTVFFMLNQLVAYASPKGAVFSELYVSFNLHELFMVKIFVTISIVLAALLTACFRRTKLFLVMSATGVLFALLPLTASLNG